MWSPGSQIPLNAFYYTLKTEHVKHREWADVTAAKALAVVPASLDSQPLFLSIDDTLVEKSGKKFELCSILFDHASHNGSNYLNGHCMVSLMLSFPVLQDEKIQYRSVPLGYRLWDKKKTKLAIAAEMVENAMKVIGSARPVILLCDSWYPKAEVLGSIEKHKNLDMICNARCDTVLYDLPPAPTGKRGRPRKYGDRLSPEQFELSEPQTGDWKVGIRPVITKLWKDRVVHAIVTSPKKGTGGRRLFLCTLDPEKIPLDLEQCTEEGIFKYGKENVQYLPLGLYSIRWNIEVSYYEGKTFWSLENYQVRSSQAIERLVNLLSVSYSSMTLLPYSDEAFSGYKSASAQDTRFEISQQIQAFIILCSFGKYLETVINNKLLTTVLEKYILSGFKKVQKL